MTQNVTPRQRKAIAALLTGATKQDAAAAAGVKRRTVYRWLQQDAFVAALRDGERDTVDALSRELVNLATDAVAVLRELVEGGESDHVRLRAVSIVLSNLLKLRELATLETRMCELEMGVYGKAKT